MEKEKEPRYLCPECGSSELQGTINVYVIVNDDEYVIEDTLNFRDIHIIFCTECENDMEIGELIPNPKYKN